VIVYDDALGADSYVVRLFANILGLAPTAQAVDVVTQPERSHPLLVDRDISLHEQAETLRYLARTYDRTGRWAPDEDPARSEVQSWLATSAALDACAGEARRLLSASIESDVASQVAAAHRILRSLDEHVWFAYDQGSGWLASPEHPTIADIACFPHVMLAPEGGITLLEYPALRRWAERVKKIPGFIPMPGIFPALLPSDVRANGEA
jgi:glutathione S-transferase